VRLDELDYDLPPDRIAQRPAEPRDASRLLVLDPVTGAIEDHRARDLPDLLEPGALIVYNDTRVIPARLLGHKAQTGGRVELLLVSELAGETCVVAGSCVPSQRWSAMGKASKPLRLPALVTIDADRLAALVERRREDGLFEVSLWCPDGSSVAAAIA
jgi:S-adenosylmethionine:tRNA ribosyltransferase-isomerase